MTRDQDERAAREYAKENLDTPWKPIVRSIERAFLAGLAHRGAQLKVAKDNDLVVAKILEDALPIVEAAYWDHHTAGVLPGSGYNNKAEHLAGRTWGWQRSERFEAWVKEAREALKKLREGK